MNCFFFVKKMLIMLGNLFLFILSFMAIFLIMLYLYFLLDCNCIEIYLLRKLIIQIYFDSYFHYTYNFYFHMEFVHIH
jgi:hypothetical protein